MNENQILRGRLSDLANRAYQHNTYTYSHFLSPEELSILEDMRNELSYIPFTCYGGNDLCERQIAAFGDEAVFGYPMHFPISVIHIRPLLEKFSDTLTHRDYLGAVMHLGIERDTIGDIMIKDKTAYLFCLETIADYICESLTKIRHTNVQCTITDASVPALAPTLQEESFPVASLRLDAIIAHLISCSRKEALALFEDKRVTLNGRITGRCSTVPKEGDIFSVRGYGKFQYTGTGGSTRKGKTYVQVNRYL